ncbi:MAG: hypothetical protein V1859_05095 [archaeon]
MPYAEVRVLPEKYSSQMSINIYSGRVALLVYSQKDPVSILIKDERIYEGFLSYFKLIWNISNKIRKNAKSLKP